MERLDRAFKVPLVGQFQNFLESKFKSVTSNALAKLTGAAKASKPRDRDFLVNLLGNIFFLVHLIGHEIIPMSPTSIGDTDLPHDATVIAKFLGEVLNECRRLIADPKLFPSRSLRKAFLTKIASLRPVISILIKMHKQSRTVYWYVMNRDLQFMEEIGPDYLANGRAKPRSLLTMKIPLFHPDKPDGKNPWNNWLDNSAVPAPGWIAIQQKIPRIGDVLNRKKIYDYDALEASVEEVSSSNPRRNGW